MNITSPKPETLRAVVQHITPEIAVRMLAENTNNRKLRRHIVERYARDMAAGNWMLNGETIIVARNCELLNGQHRLTACVRAGVGFDSLVAFGADARSFATIDQNFSRNSRDVLGLSGEVNTAQLSGALRLLWRWELRKLGVQTQAPSVNELLEVLARHPCIRDSVRTTSTMATTRRLLPPSVGAFCYYVFGSIDPNMCKQFFESLERGVNLYHGDPVLALRERIMRFPSRRGPAAEELLALCCKAWLYYRKGKRIQVLSWRSDEAFPDIWTQFDGSSK